MVIEIKLPKQDLERVKKHTIKHSKEQALEPEEEKEMFKAIETLNKNIKSETKLRYQILVHLLADSGLRISEAIQVRKSWFKESTDGLILVIPDKDRDLRNMKRDWTPKSKAGAREVIFLNQAIAEKIKTFYTYNVKGLGFSRQRAFQVIQKLGSAINKPLLHPHALRSTYANKLVYAGVNDSTLCYYMGWSDLKTAKHYVKTSKVAAKKDLMDKMKEQ